MKKFKLEIITPDREFFSGEIESLTFSTPTGEMGVLYNTLPIVSALVPGTLSIKQDGKWMEAFNGEGFVEIRPKHVIIMTQIAQWPHEIDTDEVVREINYMTERMKREQSLKEYKLAKAQLARQFAKLRLKNRSID